MRVSERMKGVKRSYIREILKVTANPEIISFAGGLPNPSSFPVEAISEASRAVLAESGPEALQYSTTEGYEPLREFIANRYNERRNAPVNPDQIIITTGSQQGLDLIGKAMLNRGEAVIVERPGYLGALQSFSIYGPEFRPVELTDEGIDTEALEQELLPGGVHLYYAVPNFQNPSGVTYNRKTRERVAELLKAHDCIMVEDDPYGELRFLGEDQPMMKSLAMDNVIALGSFSKIASPGFRVGWLAAPEDTRNLLVTAKQAADLHTSTFCQRVLHRYLMDNDLDEHIKGIRKLYGSHREIMVDAMKKYFPDNVRFTEPEGGMFLWVTMPDSVSSVKLFDKAIERKVAFVPGTPFYVEGGDNTFRLNFSNADPERIEIGIRRLGECLADALGE